jgi:DNA-binding NarL/FixJ family response regulator
VLKDQAAEVVIKAIEKVHRGEVWLDRTLTASVLSERTREARDQQEDLARIASLTEREREIVALVCQGLRNKQIAEKLFISAATVRNHLTSVLSKLELSNRVELAMYAYRQRLAKPPG